MMSYHSLEDRIVKRILAEGAGKAIAADGWTVTEMPKLLDLVTRKGVGPSDAELRLNPRSRSAKLRVAERVSSGLINAVGV